MKGDKMKLNYYSDPGHGWVKVPKKIIKELGIEDKISSYSYMKDDFVYLEEDGDLTLFCKTMEKMGKTVEFKESTSNKYSRIRKYHSYVNYTDQENNEIVDLKEKMILIKNWSKQGLTMIKNAGLDDLKYWQTLYNF